MGGADITANGCCPTHQKPQNASGSPPLSPRSLDCVKLPPYLVPGLPCGGRVTGWLGGRRPDSWLQGGGLVGDLVLGGRGGTGWTRGRLVRGGGLGLVAVAGRCGEGAGAGLLAGLGDASAADEKE